MKKCILIFIIYVVIFGGIIFCLPKNVSESYIESNNIERFTSETIGPDRVALIESPEESVKARIDIIKQAEQTLDIAYYRLSKGEATDYFVGFIQEAADRGVKVRLLLDGLTHGLNGNERSKIYMMRMHPNIEIKFYEKPNILMPWTINNRLHEKYIISDDGYVLLGGRNIGDHYTDLPSYTGKVTHDRDVLVISEEEESVIYDVKDRFEEIWNSPYSYIPGGTLTKNKQEKAILEYQELNQKVEYFNSNIEYEPIEWEENSHLTHKVTLIANPITRYKKEPLVWYEISELMKEAQDSIIMQSPYIIPTPKMKQTFKLLPTDTRKVQVLTNSMASSPNIPGYSGYIRNRRSLVKDGLEIHEYQGPGSIHAKTIVIDDRLSIIGSFNLEARSSYLSTETMLVIDSIPFTKELKEEMGEHFTNSLEIGKDYKYIPNETIEPQKVPVLKRIILYVVSIITMFFDYLL